MDDSEMDEFEQLRQEMRSNSLGDRPHGMSALKLRRLIQLEQRTGEPQGRQPYCWVCRTHHQLTADKCPGMWDIA